MKKLIYISTLSLLVIIFSGCANRNVDVTNIPFEVMDQSNYTLEKTAKNIKQPIIVATDKQQELEQAYVHLKNDAQGIDFAVDQKNELALMIFRGSGGDCNISDLHIKKISREKNTLIVAAVIDNNKTKDEEKDSISCKNIIINPYNIVKIQKEAFSFYKGIKIKLVNADTGDALDSASVNSIPMDLE